MNWTPLRGLFYAALLTGLPAVAIWLASMGWGTYDEVSGVFTLTIDIRAAAAWIVATAAGPGVALLAVIKGWGRK